MTALPLDATRFAAETERITNEVSFGEWVTLYHPDAVAEWIFDGVRRCFVGLDEIRLALTVLAELWTNHPLRVRKRVVCADDDTIVLTYEGGFDGRSNQFGTEIWTFRGDKVIRHEMYGYLDVRSRDSTLGQLRMLLVDPRIALSVRRAERKHLPPFTG
ncbi:hypothetical protein NDR87_25205 [Nocardia sp. CDC159]|uniref:SnoaL-like domain-containing protein n=1 Tax=Nocardia pulmonis TaxID=2951408 RepID=A0A9X2E906_9NOCA|nr:MULTISPECIES: nuclear transport factor 2 family protein [Nocardia]MCM6775203.1 hypothetical protein [Nocardia pulmonis]MCM6789673.1 hypothetical protein [Nocardia sp. CDC159]